MQRLTLLPQESCGSRRRVLTNLRPRCDLFYNSKPLLGHMFSGNLSINFTLYRILLHQTRRSSGQFLTRVVAARASEEAMIELAGRSSLQAVVDAAFAASAARLRGFYEKFIRCKRQAFSQGVMATYMSQ